MHTGKLFKLLTVLLLILVISINLNAEPGLHAENQAAPDFNLQDQEGNNIKLSDYEDKIVVLEWLNPDCPYVQRHYKSNTMKNLSEKYNKEVKWLAINSTYYMDNTDNKKWVDKYDLPYSILNDSSGNVGKLYGAKTTPHMYIKDSNGKLVYIGAIDDDPKGTNNQVVNFVDTALAEITSDQVISVPETKSYGCSVKYKNN